MFWQTLSIFYTTHRAHVQVLNGLSISLIIFDRYVIDIIFKGNLYV